MKASKKTTKTTPLVTYRNDDPDRKTLPLKEKAPVSSKKLPPKETSLYNPQYLHNVLDYCPRTGEFTWMVKPSKRIAVGERAGRVVNANTTNPVRMISYNGVTYPEAKLAYVYQTGKLPEGEVGYDDKNPTNICWWNLGILKTPTPRQAKLITSNTTPSGVRGIGWNKKSERWIANLLTGSSERKYVGSFEILREAKEALLEATAKYEQERVKNAPITLVRNVPPSLEFKNARKRRKNKKR